MKYRILVVDDEKMVREGISKGIDWDRHGYELVGAAENGVQALEMIAALSPHIVITDIRMPGLDGLGLIRQAGEAGFNVEFIVVSGYDEFDYAHQAMRFGVQHYLLKPCDEEEILLALGELVAKLEGARQKERLYNETRSKLQKATPQLGEQFFNRMLTGAAPDKAEEEFLLPLLKIPPGTFRLLLLKVEGQPSPINRYALKEMAQKTLAEETVVFSTVRDEYVLLLVQFDKDTRLEEKLAQVRDSFIKLCSNDLTIAVGQKTELEALAGQYQLLKETAKQSFYIGAGSILAVDEAEQAAQLPRPGQWAAFDEIAQLAKAGNTEAALERLDRVQGELRDAKQDIVLTRAFCMELMLMVSRQAPQEAMEAYLQKTAFLAKKNTLSAIFDMIREVVTEITQLNYRHTAQKHEQLIGQVMQLIRDCLGSPDLSLRWIAREKLFMNEDYLGKLFYRQTGKRFTQYLLAARMEKAKSLLAAPQDYRIYEVTEQIGFEDNAPYFSQVFKKATGYTPSEYKALFRRG